MKVPLCKMYMDDEIKKTALDVLDSGRFINGKQSKKFESEFADYIGCKRAISVNSGTSALFIKRFGSDINNYNLLIYQQILKKIAYGILILKFNLKSMAIRWGNRPEMLSRFKII